MDLHVTNNTCLCSAVCCGSFVDCVCTNWACRRRSERDKLGDDLEGMTQALVVQTHRLHQ